MSRHNEGIGQVDLFCLELSINPDMVRSGLAFLKKKDLLEKLYKGFANTDGKPSEIYNKETKTFRIKASHQSKRRGQGILLSIGRDPESNDIVLPKCNDIVFPEDAEEFSELVALVSDSIHRLG